MLTSSGLHLGLLSLALTKTCYIRPPPLTFQPLEGLSCMSTVSFDRPYSCFLCFNLPSLVTSKWRPYERLKWEWHALLDPEILWAARLFLCNCDGVKLYSFVCRIMLESSNTIQRVRETCVGPLLFNLLLFVSIIWKLLGAETRFFLNI